MAYNTTNPYRINYSDTIDSNSDSNLLSSEDYIVDNNNNNNNYDTIMWFKATISSQNDGIEIIDQHFSINDKVYDNAYFDDPVSYNKKSFFSYLNFCNSIAINDIENGYNDNDNDNNNNDNDNENLIKKSLKNLPIPDFIPYHDILWADSINKNNNNINNNNNKNNNDNSTYMKIKLTYLRLYKKHLYPSHIHLLFDDNINCNNNKSHFNSKIINYKDSSKNTITEITSSSSLDNATTSLDQFDNNDNTRGLISQILNLSYKDTFKMEKSILILINPHGGKGSALDMFNKFSKPILDSIPCINYKVFKTNYYKHATDIIKNFEHDELLKFDIICCASGDGIPYEVINGLYNRDDKIECFQNLVITQLPCGSGNGMSISCHHTNNLSFATLSLVKSPYVISDLMACTQLINDNHSYNDDGDEEVTLSFLSQNYGIIAYGDIGTEWLRWCGPLRFDIGVLIQVIKKSKYPCDLYLNYFINNDREEIKEHFQLNYDSNSNSNSNRNRNRNNNSELTLTDDSFNLKFPKLNKPLNNNDGWESLINYDLNNLGILYTGKMPYMSNNVPFFPTCLPDDGLIDFVYMNSNLSFVKKAGFLLDIENGSSLINEHVNYSKIKGFRLIPKNVDKDYYLSVDGESYSVKPIQVEVLLKICKILLKDGCFAKTPIG
ncbi:uncharacterized protein ASCRUDRAFT_74900 [Ascoidea rubescens DSM 1968]|uniref:DAGKc domain-containing protein n=1 Tax=Ascoidea rubescens DSM 1968 TaxID=1344418 RepID=A0A1D2VLP2_9ASCO|nr:hypothetical protein ASCRUDRAFT_74900 [Ascoidea rubescens DSM 1968]ODV62540.1 hypothetical protein ASCRUDRAFT_74900 [Ascoidea rubescens DSM 1968]